MTTYALMHGAWHSGWHWNRLAAELSQRGHRVIAPDLPIHDPQAGGIRYAEVVLDALGPTAADVVVVGHSMGGLAVPLVAAARPVRRMVFLGAFFPTVGLSADDSVPASALTPWFRDRMRDLVRHPDGSTQWPEEAAIEAFFSELPADEAREAAGHLRRQYYKVWDELCPLESWPAVPSTYIVCDEDRSVDPLWSRLVSQDALGVEAVVMKGGHEPFLTAPDQLATILDGLEPPAASVA